MFLKIRKIITASKTIKGLQYEVADFGAIKYEINMIIISNNNKKTIYKFLLKNQFFLCMLLRNTLTQN